MNQPLRHFQHTASRGAACVGLAWVDSGITSGLAGFETRVDSNRPAMNIAAARGLLKQFGAAH